MHTHTYVQTLDTSSENENVVVMQRKKDELEHEGGSETGAGGSPGARTMLVRPSARVV